MIKKWSKFDDASVWFKSFELNVIQSLCYFEQNGARPNFDCQ